MNKFFNVASFRKNPMREEDSQEEREVPIGEDVMMPLHQAEEERAAEVERVPFMGQKDPSHDKKNKFSWGKVSRTCLYLLCGVMPFWFLPFSAYPVDDAKIFFIALLVFIASAAWLAQVLATGRVEIVKTKVWLFSLLFFFLAAISTIFSLSPALSVWGSNHQPDTLFALMYGFLAFFIVPTVFRSAQHIRKAQIFLGVSAIIVGILSLLQFFGKYPLFFDFTRSTSFNVFGSVEDLGVFLGLGLVVIIALLSILPLRKRARWAFTLGACVLALALLFLNASYVWLGLMLGFALAASWQVVRGFTPQQVSASSMRTRSHFGLFIVLMLVSAVIFFVGIPVGRIVSLPPTVSPSFFTTLGIAKDTFHEGAGRMLIGSGPGTFLYQYLIHRPDAINATSFFSLRFLQGFSFVSTLLVSLGLLGFFSLLWLIGYFLFQAFRGISLRAETSANQGEILVSFIGFVFLLFSWFFYPMNVPLVVLTFLLAGLILADIRNRGAMKEVHISFNQSPQAVFTFSFAAVVLLALITVSAYWHVQKYTASVVSAMGVQEYNASSGKAIDDATSKIGFAVSLDGTNDLYLRTLSQLFTVRANNVLQNSSSSTSKDSLQQEFQQEFQGAIQAAHLATSINDRDPLNWEALGDVYANFLSVVGGSDTFAIDSYQKMVDRDPKDPAAYLTLAQAYMNAADAASSRAQSASQGGSSGQQSQETQQSQTQAKDYLQKAQDVLKQAIALKSDYAPALFLSAQVYDRQGDRAQAIGATQQAEAINPQDVGIAYQLGLLYYLNNQFDLAQQALEHAVVLDPNYSNARYFLGLVYNKQGQVQKALDQFQQIQKLNSDNTQIKQIITNLQAGKDALDGLTPPQQTTQTPVPQNGGAQPPTQLKK